MNVDCQARETTKKDEMAHTDSLRDLQGPKRRITKGITADQLLNNLKEDFIDQGLDAYNQFRKMGVGVEHNDEGQLSLEGGIVQGMLQKQRKFKEDSKKGKFPLWFNPHVEDFLEIGELNQYLDRKK